MRQLVYGEPLVLQNVPEPVPGPGEVVIDIRRAAVNPLDVWVSRGTVAAAGPLPRTGGSEGAFITLAGVENSHDVYGSVAGIHDIPDPEAFAAQYKAEYSKDPGAYSALAYACTQVLLQAIDKSAGSASDMAALREAVRAYVFTTSNKFDTVLGSLSFDENGDSSQKFISFYKVDPAGADGKGNWVFVKQQDFAAGL